MNKYDDDIAYDENDSDFLFDSLLDEDEDDSDFLYDCLLDDDEDDPDFVYDSDPADGYDEEDIPAHASISKPEPKPVEKPVEKPPLKCKVFSDLPYDVNVTLKMVHRTYKGEDKISFEILKEKSSYYYSEDNFDKLFSFTPDFTVNGDCKGFIYGDYVLFICANTLYKIKFNGKKAAKLADLGSDFCEIEKAYKFDDSEIMIRSYNRIAILNINGKNTAAKTYNVGQHISEVAAVYSDYSLIFRVAYKGEEEYYYCTDGKTTPCREMGDFSDVFEKLRIYLINEMFDRYPTAYCEVLKDSSELKNSVMLQPTSEHIFLVKLWYDSEIKISVNVDKNGEIYFSDGSPFPKNTVQKLDMKQLAVRTGRGDVYNKYRRNALHLYKKYQNILRVNGGSDFYFSDFILFRNDDDDLIFSAVTVDSFSFSRDDKYYGFNYKTRRIASARSISDYDDEKFIDSCILPPINIPIPAYFFKEHKFFFDKLKPLNKWINDYGKSNFKGSSGSYKEKSIDNILYMDGYIYEVIAFSAENKIFSVYPPKAEDGSAIPDESVYRMFMLIRLCDGEAPIVMNYDLRSGKALCAPVSKYPENGWIKWIKENIPVFKRNPLPALNFKDIAIPIMNANEREFTKEKDKTAMRLAGMKVDGYRVSLTFKDVLEYEAGGWGTITRGSNRKEHFEPSTYTIKIENEFMGKVINGESMEVNAYTVSYKGLFYVRGNELHLITPDHKDTVFVNTNSIIDIIAAGRYILVTDVQEVKNLGYYDFDSDALLERGYNYKVIPQTKVYDIETGNLMKTYPEKGPVNKVTIAPDGHVNIEFEKSDK